MKKKILLINLGSTEDCLELPKAVDFLGSTFHYINRANIISIQGNSWPNLISPLPTNPYEQVELPMLAQTAASGGWWEDLGTYMQQENFTDLVFVGLPRKVRELLGVQNYTKNLKKINISYITTIRTPVMFLGFKEFIPHELEGTYFYKMVPNSKSVPAHA